MSKPAPSFHPHLPYRDTKPQGAADFYFAINATFRWMRQRLGVEKWVEYLQQLGRGYYEPVNRQWKKGGLSAVADYWRDFFSAEPGAEVEVRQLPEKVEIHVQTCPAIQHLKKHNRRIVPEFCQHCYYLGQARAEASGQMQMRLEGGDGSCVHHYYLKETSVPPQDFQKIKRVS